MATSVSDKEGQYVDIDVLVRYRVVRMTKDHVKGNIIYSTTLLPGETTKLFTSSRRTDSTYNSSTQQYEQDFSSKAESSYMNAIQESLSVHSYESSASKDIQEVTKNKSWNASGSAGLDLGFFNVGGCGDSSEFTSSVDMSSQFVDSVESAATQAEIKVNNERSVNISSSRSDTTVKAETNQTTNVVSRTITNCNKSCPVTYHFRTIDKCMETRCELVGIAFR